MTDNAFTEIARIREAYAERDRKISSTTWNEDIYHPRHPIGRLFSEHNHAVLVDALNRLNIDLTDTAILDFGCGEGAWLRFLVELGANPANLHGIDLSEQRIKAAREINPAIDLTTSRGDLIPFPADAFDIVMQVVVFSSILNRDLAKSLLAEMCRVAKPGGYLFWIDHKKSHSESLEGYPVELLSNWLPECSLVYQESVHPRYFRTWSHHPWLCRLVYDFTRMSCDAWFLIFRKHVVR